MKLQQIFEGISPIVFHYTSIRNAASIIDNNRFKLSTSFGTDAEGWLAQKNKIYYLSTTRHKLGGYHLMSGRQGVMLNLDGNKLSNRYSGEPVDYWGSEFRKLDPTKGEAEDRIYHTKPTIPDAIDYIKEVHVYIKQEDFGDENTQRSARKLLISLKKNNIPHYFYNNHRDWMLQNKNKATAFPIQKTSTPGPGYYRKRRGFGGYIELFKKDSVDQLSKSGVRAYNYLYNQRDFISQLKADIHNSKSAVEESGLQQLLDIFKQNKLTSANEVFDYLYDKWVSR